MRLDGAHSVQVRNRRRATKQQPETWADGKDTSTTEGSRRRVRWQWEGLVKFNTLSKMVKQQREVDKVELEGENEVDLKLMEWCCLEAGMT